MKHSTSNYTKSATVLAAFLTCAIAPAFAGKKDAPPDKSGYHLFNPTPAESMREMATDRPDKTESPYTVDAGHFQIEMDVFSFTHDRDTSGGGNVRTDSWAFAPVNLKVGLCNTVDFQLVVETWNEVRTDDRGARAITHQSGFGDLTARLKINLWGNDGGPTAFGLMPFVKIPTNQDDLGNNGVEGGLILPLAVELPGGWSMGLMTEYDYVRNGEGSGYHSEFINTVTVSHDIIGDLGGYVEFFSAISTESQQPWVGTVDCGLTYGLTKNIQLDAGVNIGVTESADNWNPFLGVSVRF